MLYLDNNATTPVLPEVLEAMMPYLTTEWGNPSSAYRFGSAIKSTMHVAREQVARLIGARASEIVFTSGGTEANNAAIRGAARVKSKKNHIVTSAVEHSSIIECVRSFVTVGHTRTTIGVDAIGNIDLAEVDDAIADRTAVVSLMMANNETGVIWPVGEISELCRSRGVLFHSDAVQAVGKMIVSVGDMPIDYLSISGHKLGAPKGIGALYIRRGAPFQPLIIGGHQERGRRGGTENVAYIAGIGVAAEIASDRMDAYENHVRPLRDELESRLLAGIEGAEVNGAPGTRVCNTSNIHFKGIRSEAMLILLDQEGVCASAGSACLADVDEPSHVIRAMKPDTVAARESIRFSLGMKTSSEDIEKTVAAVKKVVLALRQ